MFVITLLQQAKRDETRVNVFLDGEFWLSLGKNLVLELSIFKGKEITENEKAEIESSAKDEKLLGKIYQFVLWRKRSIKEVSDHLKWKFSLDQNHIDKIINKLKEQELLDDLKFCEWYVKNRITGGINGRNKIKAELQKKGVNKQLIEEVLARNFEVITEVQGNKIKDFAEKIIKNSPNLDRQKLKQRIYTRLRYRGFSYDEIERVIRELLLN